MGLLDRLPGRSEPGIRPPATPPMVGDAVFSTKALRKFLSCLVSRESPVLLDLGPVVGSNVTFFGEQLGCKIFVEDIFADLDRANRDSRIDAFPSLLSGRFSQAPNSVDGVLCWDLIDFLDWKSAVALATELTRILRPDGALLAFFATTRPQDTHHTKFVVVDDANLKHRPYPAARGRQTVMLNRDIIKLFATLRVSDSFLLQNNIREILFRKPA